MASSGIPSTGSVSVGTTAGTTRSINTLILLAAETQNSSLDAREKNYMDNLLTYGACMPGQIQKDANWAPTGTGGTWRSTGMGEFRGSYRWANIVSGNPMTASSTANPPGPGNSILTVTGQGSPAYIGSGTPYSFYITGPGGRKPAGSGVWKVANLVSGTRTTFGGDGTGLSTGTYTCFVRDFEGCGSASNLSITASVTYP
jgi:hypothetical protein